jgi:hypothetical protein
MNGDNRADFVLTRACNDSAIGTSSWSIYFNTGTGFAANVTSFALPVVAGALGSSGAPVLASLDGSDGCSAGGETASWTVLDVNGDYEPDFLLTQACDDAMVGSSRWDVYVNTGKGFSASATSFTLPTIAGAVGMKGQPPFPSLGGSDNCASSGTAKWSVLYMNANDELGFLLTQACTGSAIGTSQWSVYLAPCGP